VVSAILDVTTYGSILLAGLLSSRYRVYKTKSGDDMYTPKSKRIKIW
jgi:predicted metalloendopeptidase